MCLKGSQEPAAQSLACPWLSLGSNPSGLISAVLPPGTWCDVEEASRAGGSPWGTLLEWLAGMGLQRGEGQVSRSPRYCGLQDQYTDFAGFSLFFLTMLLFSLCSV